MSPPIRIDLGLYILKMRSAYRKTVAALHNGLTVLDLHDVDDVYDAAAIGKDELLTSKLI